MLRFAGSTADIVGVNASVHSGEIDTAAAQDSLPDRIDQKVAWVRQGACDRRRRQRVLGKLTPVEYELAFANDVDVAA